MLLGKLLPFAMKLSTTNNTNFQESKQASIAHGTLEIHRRNVRNKRILAEYGIAVLETPSEMDLALFEKLK